jgi:subtilisin family serine protease
MPESVGAQGVFPAAFSGVGPHIGVCAPGVAVLSTVPGGHAALDGTGTAAVLVAGLAALILAHHPLFQGPMKARSEQRVGALFNLLRASAVPQFTDALRGGAGVPDLQRVPGLYGLTGAGLGAPAAVFDDVYAAGGLYGGAPVGVMPFLASWPAMGPAWAPSGWAPLVEQMRRTAGPI